MSARRKFARRHGGKPLDSHSLVTPWDGRSRDTRKGASSVDNFAEQSRRGAQVAQVLEAAFRQYVGAPHTSEDIARAMLAMDRMLYGLSVEDMTTGERVDPERLRYDAKDGVFRLESTPSRDTWWHHRFLDGLSRKRVNGYEVNLAQSGRMASEGWEGGELARAVAESDKWEACEHAELSRPPVIRLTVDGATHDVTSLEIDGRKYSGVNTGRTPVRHTGEEHVATVDLQPLRICDCEVCRVRLV